MLTIKTTGLEEFMDPSGGGYIKMLLMGDAGVGKTPSAACWPKPIIADCEKGLMSVASKAVPYATIETSTDMDQFLDHLRRDSMLPPEKRKYQTLVLDTIDTYQRKLIQERLKAERKETFSGHGDWGWLEAKMTQLIEAMLNLKMNVVVNMHVKDVQDGDEDNQILVKKAKLKGDIKDSIWQDFDLIGLMEKSWVMEDAQRVIKRQIRWQSEPRFPTLRDRSNTLPRFTDVDFTDQDYYRIFEPITAGMDNLPDSADVEAVEAWLDDTVVPGADEKGGPVDKPDLPRPQPAKKAAAKKATAKKAAATPPATSVEESKPDPWAPPEVNGKGTAEEPVVIPKTASMVDESKAKEVLDHVHTEDGACLKNTFGDTCGSTQESGLSVDDDDQAAEAALAEVLGAEEVTEEPPAPVEPTPNPEPEAAVEPEPGPPAEPPKKAAKHCGDQPASMVGKHEPVPGCGVELNAQNGTRAQLSMVKFKTYLCDQDFLAQSKP